MQFRNLKLRPLGLQSLFNGKDLTGWHGWAIHAKGAGPYDLAKLSPEAVAKMRADWTADAGKHWSVADGAVRGMDEEIGRVSSSNACQLVL